jgi:hypothetical protein
MDAVPIVPPLFRGTKNTTLHELQTGDRSRATDNPRALPCHTACAGTYYGSRMTEIVQHLGAANEAVQDFHPCSGLAAIKAERKRHRFF